MLNGKNLPFTGCLMMICLLIGSLDFREALTNLIAKFRRFTPSLQAIFRGINPTFCMYVYVLIRISVKRNQFLTLLSVAFSGVTLPTNKDKAFCPFVSLGPPNLLGCEGTKP